ncbi:hypothetical protein [Hymenobacter sp. B1770]|uniref:hypothetical protein n=1 Tax=Hymenobacter sp. B1770 TaxID=1718788 RepID=UPI003CF800C3
MYTRLLFTLLACLMLISSAHAQDLLTKRNGDELTVKVVEITPAEVRYRRTDNPDGPVISVWRSDVFMIRYANGTKEVFGNGAAPASSTAPSSATREPLPGEVPVVSNASPNDAILSEPIHLDGPRIGFTVLSPGVVDKARDRGTELNPFLTQFGWQFESRLFRLPNGLSGLVEFVPLIGGLEQGKFIPSISGLVGIRGAKGFEFGMGPNLTPLGANIVLAMGTSIQSNGINFPINLAVVPGSDGVRFSLLVGFNARHR